jgi:hypothetical protein
MADVLPARIPPGAPRPFLQFGLGTMLWITTAVAVVCTIVFRIPTECAVPLSLFISLALPAVLTTVIIYGRSYQRTFCIGAMFPAVFFLLSILLSSGMTNLSRWNLSGVNLPGFEDFAFRTVVCSFWGSNLLIGGVCVGVRRLVERRPTSPPELGNIGPGTRTAIASMTELLKDKDEVVGRAAAGALEKIDE